MSQSISEISLKGVMPHDITFRRGTHYCVRASSGVGKTSMCSFIMGVRVDYRGQVLIDGEDTHGYSIERWCGIRRHEIAYLPQELAIFDTLSAFDNVLIKNRLTDFHSESDIRHMFEALEIDNHLDRPAGLMSVGQKQRVAIIRTLCQPCGFILLDEPVSHLDATNNSLCAKLIADEASAQKASVIFTSVGNPLALPLPVTNLDL